MLQQMDPEERTNPSRGRRSSARRIPPGAESDEELLRRYSTDRSPARREELVRRFMPLARSLALRYRRQTESLDDLVQVAGLGLVKAIDRFDPAHERGFAAFAVPTILGELRRHFRDHVWTLRLPRGLQELTMKVDEATSTLTEELGRVPTPTEVAARLGISVEDVLEALEAGHARRTLSLDAPNPVDDEDSLPALERSATPTPATTGSRPSSPRTPPASRSASGRCCGCASWTSSPSRRSATGWASHRCRSRGSAGGRCGSS